MNTPARQRDPPTAPGELRRVPSVDHAVGQAYSHRAGVTLYDGRATITGMRTEWTTALLTERLRDLEAMVEAITDCAIIQLDANGDVARWCPGAE
ncbi:hypothetical protein MAHJHV57_54660 [Mycobacterium avium subsp. hominissuis]